MTRDHLLHEEVSVDDIRSWTVHQYTRPDREQETFV